MRTRRCGCATRRGRKSCRRSRTSTAANSSRIGGVRPCGPMSAANTATTWSARSIAMRVRSGSPLLALEDARPRSTTKSCRPNWHAAIRSQYSPIMRRRRGHTRSGDRSPERQDAKCHERVAVASAPTAGTSCSSRRAICSPSICFLRKRRPDESCASSSILR